MPINTVNTFGLDTNAEWLKRRSAFRHAFAVSQLQKQDSFVKKLVAKLCFYLESASKENKVVKMDVIFGQLAFDAICEVAFQMDVGALDDSTEFQVIRLFA